MRESNFSFPSHNRAAVCITSALYDRRALDCTAPLPLCNSLTHLTYLTSTSPRIREILTVDGGLERLVRVLKIPIKYNDRTAVFRWSLSFQCVVNVGVRGSEAIRNRVVEAGMVPVVIGILERYLKATERAKGATSAEHHLQPLHHHGSQHARSHSDNLTARQRPPAINLSLANGIAGPTGIVGVTTPTTPSMQDGSSETIQASAQGEPFATQSIPPSPTSNFAADHLQLVRADNLNPPPAVTRLGFGSDDILQPQVDDAIENVETPVVIPSGTLPLDSDQVNIPHAPTMRPHPFVAANANVSPEDQETLRREDDIMLSLQLLAYLSKYSHLRTNFHTAYSKNVFSVVEQFTYRTYPQEIQYWAGVIMRNACRKDESRGGVRQCAYMSCGKWEKYPREFAKCRRCRKAKYCSKLCQSRAWAEGHRWWCIERHPTAQQGSGADTDPTANGSVSLPSRHHRHHHGGSHGAAMAAITAAARQNPPGFRFTPTGAIPEPPVAAAALADPVMFANTDRRQRAPPVMQIFRNDGAQTWPRATQAPHHHGLNAADIVMTPGEHSGDNADDEDIDVDMDDSSRPGGLGMILS